MDRRMKWAMTGWSAVIVLFGLGLTGAAFEATDGFTRAAFAVLRHPEPMFTPELRFAIALMGAVMLGWGLTIGSVAAASDRLDAASARAIWGRVAVVALAWFVIDSALSIATGFALNAVSNAVLTAAFFGILVRGGALDRW